MLALLLAAALATAEPKSCLPPDPADVVVERQVLNLGDEPGSLEAYSVSRRGEDGPYGFESSRIVIYGEDCKIRYQQVFADKLETHFTLSKLGDVNILLASVITPGGSGNGFLQVVLGYEDQNVFALAPGRLDQSNMDGFHVGDLGKGRGGKARGPGLMLWTALWENETHYAPHRYRVTTYRWKDDHFTGPEVWTTRKRYDPDPESVGEILGLPAEQTQANRFRLDH